MVILCVTPNVSVDRILRVPGFAAGGVWRARAVAATCGGKGINVARALRHLGHPSTCAGLLGGHTGHLAAEAVRIEGLDAAWTWVGGETRTCVTIIGDNGETTVVNEPGASVTASEWSRFLTGVGEAAERADAVCISGSVPPRIPDGGLARLIEAAKVSRGPVWVDTSGAALSEAIGARPNGIKINAAEAGAMMSREVNTVDEAVAVASDIRNRGLDTAAVTLSGNGAVLVAESGAWRARPPEIDAVSSVGSGDCFLAGLVAAMAQGQNPADALRLATAAGAANALNASTGEIAGDQLAVMMAQSTVEPVNFSGRSVNG